MIANPESFRRKTVALLCLFYLSSLAGMAQRRKLDSLDRLIQASATDTARTRLTELKARNYAEINLDSAIYFARIALAGSMRANYRKVEVASRLDLASNFCFKGDYDSALLQLRKAGQITADLHDTTQQSKIASIYGMLYGMQGKYDSSLTYFLQSAGHSERAHDSVRLANDYRNISSSYQMQSRFSEALEYSQKSLRISEALHDLRNQAYLNLNMGMVYNGIYDSARSEQCYLKAIDLARQQNIVNVQLYATTNVASLYVEGRNFAKAYEYAVRGETLARESGDIGMQATATGRVAESLYGLNRVPEALTMAARAISLAEDSKQNFNIYQTNNIYGHILNGEGKFREAIPYFEKGFTVMKGTDLFDHQYELSYNMLSMAYEKSGRFQEALTALQMAKKISDSIVSKENVRKTTESALRFDYEKKEQLTLLQKKQDEQVARNKQNILIVGLSFTLLLAAAAWYAFNIKRRANRSLEEQKVTLQTALTDLKSTQAQLIQSEKMASLGELTAGIAHEIQNPLNFVNNFSEVSVELIEELNEAVVTGNESEARKLSTDLAGNLEKILSHGKRAAAIVKGMLQHSRSSSDQKELTDLNALAEEYLRLSYHGLRARNKSFSATLNTDFDASLQKISIVPQDIGRVILNMLTNAFYAIDDKQKSASVEFVPAVRISTKRTGEWVTVSIRDNGNGIPEKTKEKMFQPFFTTKPTGQGTGLGLSLSYDIIKAHGGDIQVNSTDGEGSEFIIRLPHNPG